MLISIIITVYNAEKYLAVCLDSCLNQTFQNIEIIIVNDGSSDGSLEIISTYLEKDRRCRLFNKKNEGLVKARKDGVQIAKGDFIFFLDADDVIIPQAIEILVSEQQVTNADVVLANFWVETEKGHIMYRTQNTFKYGKEDKAMLLNLLSKSFGPTIWGKLIRKNIFSQINVPNFITIGEDVIANMQIIMLENVKFANVDDCIYHYIQHTNSMVNARNKKTAAARLQYVYYIQNSLEKCKYVNSTDYIEAYTSFLLGEYFSFLKDGGLPSMCAQLSMEVKEILNSKPRILGFFRHYLIRSYLFSDNIGLLYRGLYLTVRNCYLWITGLVRL